MIKINTNPTTNQLSDEIKDESLVDNSDQMSEDEKPVVDQPVPAANNPPKATFIHYELTTDGQPLLVDGDSFDAVTFKESASKVFNSLSEDKRQAFLVKVCAAFGLPTDFAAAPKDEVVEVASAQGEKIASLSNQPLSQGGVLRTGDRMVQSSSEPEDESDEYDFEEIQ